MATCEVLGCDKEAKARKLCSAHYSQLRRTGSPTGSLKQPESVVKGGFIPKQPLINCSVIGCNNTHFCKSYCSLHYQRWTDHGSPEPEHLVAKDKNICSRCKVNTRRENYSWCQPCNNENTRKWNASEAGPRWRRYKLKKQDIINMKASQGNSCAICGDSFDEVADHVDHDNRCCGKEKVHNGGTCGKCVRSLLCGSCNQGLGNFKDSPERLEKAINYLRKWSH